MATNEWMNEWLFSSGRYVHGLRVCVCVFYLIRLRSVGLVGVCMRASVLCCCWSRCGGQLGQLFDVCKYVSGTDAECSTMLEFRSNVHCEYTKIHSSVSSIQIDLINVIKCCLLFFSARQIAINSGEPPSSPIKCCLFVCFYVRRRNEHAFSRKPIKNLRICGDNVWGV